MNLYCYNYWLIYIKNKFIDLFLFLLYHIAHATPKETSKSQEVPDSISFIAISIISIFTSSELTRLFTQQLHTLLATSHLTKTWKFDSSSFPQAGQISQILIPFLCKFTKVGRAFRHIFQAKIHTLGGMFKCQNFFHRGLLASPKELSPSSIVSSTLTAI